MDAMLDDAHADELLARVRAALGDANLPSATREAERHPSQPE